MSELNQTEQNQINPYFLLARAMTEIINPRLAEFYKEQVKDTQMEAYFYNAMNGGESEINWFATKMNEPGFEKKATFVNILYWILEQNFLIEGNPRFWQTKYSELKRSKKNHIFRVIRDEYTNSPKSNNPLLLKITADHYFALSTIDGSMKKYASRQEYIDELYHSVMEWKKDSNSFLIDFMFFDTFKPKRKAAYFENDLCDHLFRIINEEFYGNINGVLTSTPRDINNVFNYRKDNIDLSHLDIDDKNLFAKTSSSIEENGMNIMQDIVYRLKTGVLGGEDKKKFDIISDFKKENPDAKIISLSTDESDVLANVYSSFNAAMIKEGYIVLDGKTFVRRVLGKKSIKARDSKKVLSSIDKLSSVNINVTRRGADGSVESISNYSFFDYTVGKEGTPIQIAASFNRGGSIDDIPDDLLSGDEWNIRIEPSNFLRQSWMSRTNMEIYTKMYHQIESTQAKMYMLFLQSERITEQITGNYSPYDSIRKFFSYAYFKTRVKMDKMKPYIVREKICEQLDVLKEEKVVIKDYEDTPMGIYIDFMPFTELEIDLYKIPRPDNARIES